MDEKKRIEFVEKIGDEIAEKISVRACEWYINCDLCGDVIDKIHCSSRVIASEMIKSQSNAKCGGHNYKIIALIRDKGDKFVGYLNGFEFVPFEPKCD